MRDFRNELLEYLLEHSGEMIDITFLFKKHCKLSDDGIYNEEDKTPKRIGDANDIMKELKELGWIKYQPTSGMSTASTGHSEFGKRRLLLPARVEAKMTTKGEIEYPKQFKEENKANTANIGTFAGVLIQGSSISETDFRPEIKPITNPPIVPTNAAAKQGIITRIGKFIARNIIAIIVSTVSALIAGYLIWRFGWLN